MTGSPAEPLRIAALEARVRGEADVACSLLVDAAQLDPVNQAVQLDLAEIYLDMRQLDAARAILDAQGDKDGDHSRLQVLLARLNLAAAGGSTDVAALEARLAGNAGDLDARLQFAKALALAQDYRPALEQLLELVRRDRQWQDQAARKAMLDLFTRLGSDPQHDTLVREFRIRLARTLN